ncbi:MAG: putative ABC transport system permease protein [Rhodothermales bacterium]|jgi:putative ABC transport system permease protein
MILVAVLLPAFSGITDTAMSFSSLSLSTLSLFAGLALITGFLAGSYPALYLSGFSVVGVLKGNTKGTSQGAGLRKGLVVFQFMMSIILIVGTFTIYQQLSYVRSKDLGVDRENVLYLTQEGGVSEQYDSFRQELLSEPGIAAVTQANVNPLSIGNDTISFEWEGKEDGNNTLYSVISVGYDFAETMGIDLAQGRHFSNEFGADTTNYVVNQRAVEAMGMEDPIGQAVNLWGTDGTIVGVVKDFHMKSLYSPIAPVVMRLRPQETDMVFVKTAPGQTAAALAGLEKVYQRFNPDYPLS